MMGVTRQGRVSSSRRWRSSQFIVLCQAPQLTLCKWWVIPLPYDACLIPGFAWHLYWRITKCTCTKNISWFAWWWNGQVGIHWIWLVLIFSRPHIYFLKERWKRFNRENVDAKLIKFADIFIYLYFIKQSLSKRKVSGMTMMQKRILACECFTGWIVASWRGGKIPGTRLLISWRGRRPTWGRWRCVYTSTGGYICSSSSLLGHRWFLHASPEKALEVHYAWQKALQSVRGTQDLASPSCSIFCHNRY